MDKLIEIKVNGSMVTKDSHVAGAAGEGNATRLRIEFDAGWDAYAKTVTFWDAKGENPTKRILTADLLEDMTESNRIYLTSVPPEVTLIAGKIDFAIDGYINGRRRRSAYDALTIKYSPRVPIEDRIIDPTPSQAEQLQTQIDTLLEDMTAQAVRAETAAENAENSAQAAEESRSAAYQAALRSEKYSEIANEAADKSYNSMVAAQEAQRISEIARDIATEESENARQRANEAATARTAAVTALERTIENRLLAETAAGSSAESARLAEEMARKVGVLGEGLTAEEWEFELEDGTKLTKRVVCE